MDNVVLTYLLYLAIAVPLTVWVARVLYRHGETFLIDVFDGDDRLAKAVNHLLVTGFYLLNLGYVAYFMRSGAALNTGRAVLEVLAAKVGAVAIVLGCLHLFNVWMFNTYRRRAIQRAATQGNRYAPSAWTPEQRAAWLAASGSGQSAGRGTSQ